MEKKTKEEIRREKDQETYDMILAEFKKTKEYRKLEEKKKMFHARLDYINEIRMSGEIKKAWNRYLDRLKGETLYLVDAIHELDDEDEKRCFLDLFSVIVMANIMDFMVADMNEIFQKKSKIQKYTAFDKLVGLSKELEQAVKVIVRGESYGFLDKYAEVSDEIQKMIEDKISDTLYADMMARLIEETEQDKEARKCLS